MECTKLNCPMQAGTVTENCGDNCPWRTTANVADLISRAAAIAEVMQMVEAHKHEIFHGELLHYTGVKAMIEALPAVDAVPVVRCKDCKYSIENAKHIDVACERSYDPDFYCAAGERKDSE